MMAKPMKTLELHYPMIQFLIKTIIGWGFCDIQNNRGWGKGYQPKPFYNPYRELDYSGYHKNQI